MHFKTYGAALGVACALACPSGASAAPNLLTNPSFESSPGSRNGSRSTVEVPGWVDTNTGRTPAIVRYGGTDPLGRLFPGTGDPGPRSQQFLAGGPDTDADLVVQYVPLDKYARSIDAGAARLTLSGWLGGYGLDRDDMRVQIDYADANGDDIGPQTQIGPVSLAERSFRTGLLYRETTDAVPVGTRGALVAITALRLDGSYNDGYADELSVSIDKK